MKIEKIIGRPLTDDDIMFKEDVLRRRAERRKRAEEAEKRKAGKWYFGVVFGRGKEYNSWRFEGEVLP